MAIGFPQDLSDLNSQLGGVAVAVREALRNAQRLQLQIAAVPDATFLAAPYNMAQADINTMRSAIGDLNDLGNVFQGVASTHLTGTYDYRTFSKLLWGFV
jgi:hypothetical protein